MKKWFLLILALVIMLSACGQANNNHKYGYNDLSQEQKAIVDFILSKSSTWETEKCDTVGFTKRDGQLLLSVFNLDSIHQGEAYYGWHIWYSYDTNSGEFSVDDKQYESHGLKIYNTGDILSHSKEWSAGWNTDSKKDYLANKLYRSTLQN